LPRDAACRQHTCVSASSSPRVLGNSSSPGGRGRENRKKLRKITIRRRGGDKAREMEQKKIRGSRQHQVPSTRPESTRRLRDGGFYFRKRTQTTTYADFASSEDILAEPPFPSLTGLHETQASLSPGQNAAPAQSLHAKNRTQKHARLRSLRPKVARLSPPTAVLQTGQA